MGSRAQIIGYDPSGWYNVRLDNGLQGWVSSSVVTLIVQPNMISEMVLSVSQTVAEMNAVPRAVMDHSSVNIRSGPDTSYDAFVALTMGTSVEILGMTSTGWYWVRVPDGREGWVNGTVVRVTGDSSRIPLVASPTLTP
jgi:uncharacterized protein YgiM (DUF1202 family)